MTDGRVKDGPQLTERAQADLAARREREAAALRANLKRRKQQAKNPLPPGEGEDRTGEEAGR